MQPHIFYYVRSGCLLPCHYKEYQAFEAPLHLGDDHRMLMLVRTNDYVLVKTDHLVYSFSSFLAEFGGALGLFLGFSFIMVWDWLLLASGFIVDKKNNLFRAKRPRLKTI